MVTAKNNLSEIWFDVHRLLLTIIRGSPAEAADEIFEMLGRLDEGDKHQLWAWLSEHDPNLKQWLIKQGNQRRAV
jgi:uncharacterized protein (DUF2249 family)